MKGMFYMKEDRYKEYTVRYRYTDEKNEIWFEVLKDGKVIGDGWTVVRPGYDSVAEYVVMWCL